MAKSDDEVREEFDEAVTMSATDLREWLETEESQSVGLGAEDGESTGHESGRLIVAILDKDEAEADDLDQMRRVVSYVHRHLAQRPDGDVTHTHWRYSLMNWGHDPLDD
ncbi:MAG: DUF3140 domain-containing protein [Mycobacteriaceae bacterium]